MKKMLKSICVLSLLILFSASANAAGMIPVMVPVVV